MIARTWHGWTSPGHAEVSQRLLVEEIVPAIMARKIAGLVEVQVHRCAEERGEVEFTTGMWVESMAAVKAFVGAECEQAVVSPGARVLLARFDERSVHAEVLARFLP